MSMVDPAHHDDVHLYLPEVRLGSGFLQSQAKDGWLKQLLQALRGSYHQPPEMSTIQSCSKGYFSWVKFVTPVAGMSSKATVRMA